MDELNIPTDEVLLELIKLKEMEIEIYKNMLQLNKDGRIKLMDYMKDIVSIKKYQRKITDIELLM